MRERRRAAGRQRTRVKRHPAPRIEPHALPLEPEALLQVGAGHGPQTAGAGGVDHPMPGHRRARREGVQRIPHLAGMSGQSGELGDLTVGRHPPARNPADDGVDPGVTALAHVTGAPAPSAASR